MGRGRGIHWPQQPHSEGGKGSGFRDASRMLDQRRRLLEVGAAKGWVPSSSNSRALSKGHAGIRPDVQVTVTDLLFHSEYILTL